MDYKRFARALICLVLVCALVVNISPIKVKAVIPESILIEAGIIVGSILLGLGVGMGADSTQDVFTGLVNDCVDVIKSDYDFIDEEGLATAYVSASVDESRSYYYVAKELVEAVRTWLFESETIKYTAGTLAPEGYAYYNGLLMPDCSSYNSYDFPYIVGYSYNNRYYICFSSEPLESQNSAILYGYPVGYELIYTVLEDSGEFASQYWYNSSNASDAQFRKNYKHLFFANYDLCDSGSSELLLPAMEPSSTLDSYYESLVEGIALGHVANPDDDLPTGYPVWSGGAISIPGSTADDEERTGYPIGIADTLEETLNLSQEDIWAGNSSFTSTGTDTGADADKTTIGLLGGIKDIIGKIRSAVDAIPDSIADVIAAVKAIPVAIAEAIAAVFIPAEGYVSDKWSVLMDEYPFIEDMTDSFEDLQNFLLNLGETPPIIYINLGATRGSYNMGGVVKLVDLTWYAEFKPTVDLILSAFLYLWFYWRLMLALPGIIQGTSGMWSKADSAAGAGNWERPAARLDSGTNQHLLGSSESRTRGRR